MSVVVGEGLWEFGGLGLYSWRDGTQVGTQASNIMELMSAMRRRREQLVDAVMPKLLVIQTMKFDTV